MPQATADWNLELDSKSNAIGTMPVDCKERFGVKMLHQHFWKLTPKHVMVMSQR